MGNSVLRRHHEQAAPFRNLSQWYFEIGHQFQREIHGKFWENSHILHEQKHILKLYKFVFLSWILIAWKLLQRNQGARSNIQQKYTIKVGFWFHCSFGKAATATSNIGLASRFSFGGSSQWWILAKAAPVGVKNTSNIWWNPNFWWENSENL